MIESMISRKHDCIISIFQERMKAGKQDLNKTVFQYFKIATWKE